MRRVALTALVVTLILIAAPVVAQESQFTAAVLLGGLAPYDAHLDGDFAVGVQLGWNFDRNWSLQGELTFADPSPDTPQDIGGELPPGVNRATDVMLGSLNITYNWKHEDNRLVPFISGGVSWFDIQYNDPFQVDPDNIAWGVNLGGGLRYDLAGKTFALAEVRWNALFNPSIDALQYVVGFGFGLGGE